MCFRAVRWGIQLTSSPHAWWRCTPLVVTQAYGFLIPVMKHLKNRFGGSAYVYEDTSRPNPLSFIQVHLSCSPAGIGWYTL